jgi:TRAP-type C4-dicarboxylate transport system permease small subunit
MRAGRALLAGLGAFERLACVLGFVVMAGALTLDVGARVFSHAVTFAERQGWVGAALADQVSFGGGVLGATQIGVIGMIVVAMFGMGVAAQKGGSLRARFLDGVFPKSWSSGVDRIGDTVSALMFLAIGALAVVMVSEAMVMGDVTSVLRWPIWPIQAIIAAAFLLNALRCFVYALDPSLRPREDLEPETSVVEEAPR